MLAFPPLRTALLPRTTASPSTLRRPAPPLLPCDRLLLRTVRLLWLPGLLGPLSLLPLRLLLDPLRLLVLEPGLLPLLLPGLLGTFPLVLLRSLLDALLLLLLALRRCCALLLLRLLRLLFAGLRPLCLALRALLLGGWLRPLLLLPLAFFWLALFLTVLILLRVRGDNRPKKQTQGSGTGYSNELHRHHLH
jgi:hypothetical protein